MLKRTEGIVLKNRPFHDADLIVTHLTKDYGILSSYAKSPRKIGSRFGSSLEPITYARIGIFGKEQASLPRLTQSDIIRPFSHLRESIKTFIRILEILELTLKILPERESNRPAFSLFLNTLLLLEKEPDNPLYILYYKLRLLLLSGFALKLGGCVRCGGSSERFFFSEGTILCKGCAVHGTEYIEISLPVKMAYNYLLRIRPVVLERLRLSQKIYKGLEALVDSHINYTVVEQLNTKGFIEEFSSRMSSDD